MTSIQTDLTTANAAVFVTDSSVVKRYPTTEAQLEIWLSSTQNPGASCAYNEISTLEFNGSLDTAMFQVALEKLVERHESLRSFISSDGREVVVHKAPQFAFDLFDWTADSEATIQATAREIVRSFANTPFDLQNGPLLRVAVQKLSNEKYRATIVAHHIVIDGWSLGVFVRDLGVIYDSLVGVGTEDLPDAPTYIAYADKMESYLRSDQGKADEQYWVSQFQDDIPVLDLPVTSQRPTLRTYDSLRHDHWLSPELVASVRKIGAKSGCSLFGAIFTAFQSYLSRMTGNDDLCLGIPTAGQPAMDMPNLLGHCVNTLPLRAQIDLGDSYVERMKTTRTQMLDAFDHQRYSYGTLLRKLAPTRDPSRPPMLAVSLNVDPVLDTREMGFTGLDLSIEVEPRTFENFEWFVNGVIHDDGAIELQVQYNSELFSSEAMAFYFVGFQAFLEQITESPDSPLNSHQMMTVAQRQQVICDWNDTEVTYECAETLQAEFDRTAQEHPNSIAVQFHDQSLTYREVQKRANQLANFLISRDVSQGDLVGICVDRSAEMFISVLAILKAGAGYVPLDPAYPEERLQYMCDHADVKLVVATEQHHELIKRFAKPCVAVDTFESEIAEQDAESPKTSCSKTDIAYVIFTSGSTGQPKGVRVPHQTVLNLLHSMLRQPGLAPHESILAVTSLSFDMSVSEIFLPMTCGACLAIADKETTIDGEKLAAAIAKHDAKLIQATPATWRLLANSSWSGKKDLRIVSAGEPFPADLVAPLLDRTSEVWNMYGPTETTVYSTVERLTDANATILIGDPVANTQIYILDSNGFVVPPGVEGEMFIGGAGVTCGYLNREDLTSERFTQNPWFNPFANFANWKLYKTGDVARRLFDGKIEYLRRNDKQVKIRGFRIELGEVEKCILSLDSAIQQVVAIVRQDSLGSPTLIAYWVAGSETQFAAADLREHLRESLPHYMIPKHFVRLDELPKTSNGKIDHKALPEPELQTQSAGNIIPPATDAEKFLAKVWEEILEMDGISLDDNFFELGGHSLLVMQVIARVEDASGTRLGPQDFLIGTLESLADQIEDSREISTPEPQKVKQAESEPIAEEEEPTQEQKPKTGFGLLRGFWD